MLPFKVPSHHADAGPLRLLSLVVVGAGVYLAAGVAISWIAGFAKVDHTLDQVSWPWLVACVALVPLAYVGYYLAYRCMFRPNRTLDRPGRLAIVAAGFAGFLDHGGGALDRAALEGAGATEREAKVRVTLLSGLEQGVLAVPCLVASVVLLAIGVHTPGASFTVPWVVGPLAGGAIAVWAIRRFRPRGRFGVPLDALRELLAMFARPRHNAFPLGGMLLFWITDMVILWLCIAGFGFRMNMWATVVAFGSAMIVTRRNGPLGGVGVMDLALPPTLWMCGAHWGPAILGTFAYRFFTLWLPLPAALAGLPRLRRLIAA